MADPFQVPEQTPLYFLPASGYFFHYPTPYNPIIDPLLLDHTLITAATIYRLQEFAI